MEYPLSFLVEAPDEIKECVHKIILSSDTGQEKHAKMQQIIPRPYLSKYYAWGRKQKETPPSEMVIELPPTTNAIVFQAIAEGKWGEIPFAFNLLTSKTREIAEKWYSAVTNEDKLLEDCFIEMKENLLQFMRNESISDRIVHQLVADFEKMSTGAKETRSPTKSIPKVSDLILEHRPSDWYTTTYERDFGNSNNGGNGQRLYSEVVEQGSTGHQIEKAPKMSERNGYVEPAQKLPRNDDTRWGTCPGISKLNPSSSTIEAPLISKEPEEQASNNHFVKNCKEIRDLAETLEETLDKTKGASLHKNGDSRNVPANGTNESDDKSREYSPPSRPAPRVELDSSLEDVDPENIFNILLLGETGVGKTTFINSFANYVKYESLDEALEKNPVILIKSSIAQTMNGKNGNTEMKQKIITVEANYGDAMRTSANENFAEGGESRTQEPLIHSIPWKEDGKTKLLQIIDTPGVNDTRGAVQDEANFDKILNLIGKLGQLNAICILLKPNESTLSMGFRNCLDNVLIKLHRSATENILFCFTNTRSTLYRPGDTMAPLCSYLKELEATAGVMITPNKHNIFCFDNDCFRYLCVLLKLPGAKGEKTHTALTAGWIHNIKECKKLLEKIQGLVAHQVEDTVNINNARRFLTAMARPLTEIAQNHILNRRMMEKQMKQIRELSERGEQLGSLVEQKEVVIYRRDLAQPRTICTAVKCSEPVVGAGNKLEYVPKNICHDNCLLKGTIPPSIIGHERLRGCSSFNAGGNCRECGCSVKIHMHMTYEIEKKERIVATLAEQAEFRACKNHKQRAQLALKDLENKLINIENEFELIKETSFEFSAFLKYNSMKSGTDPYFDFLNTAIEAEKNMAEHHEDKTLLLDLKGLLKEYNKGVAHHLDELKAKRRPPLTTAEMWTKVDNLSKMKLSGSLIADVAKAVREEQYANGTQ